MRRRRSLASQLLAWQLVVVTLLLCAVGALTVVQTGSNFRSNEERRMLSVAETVAANSLVQEEMGNWRLLSAPAETARSLSGASYVLILNENRLVIASPDPSQIGSTLDTRTTALEGRSWTGTVGDSIEAHVPVFDPTSRRVNGMVIAGAEDPGIFAGALAQPVDVLRYLAIALLIGVTGSLLLARRVKNQTLGLEPHEITALVENREALLHGIREGVVGLDGQNRITLVNDHASDLLALPEDAVGRSVEELELNDRLRDVLTGRATGVDQLVLRQGVVLTLNRMPIEGGEGAVVTLRDRTELLALQHELDASQHATDTLRAQAHEFANRLHTIAGLIALKEYDEVTNYIHQISSAQDQWRAEVGESIGDPAVAALLIAKASLAAERGTALRMGPDSVLGRVDEALSADLVMVLGNLVDNALDALSSLNTNGAGKWIEVGVMQLDDEVQVVVRDSGPGVAPELAEEVFRHGFTTKAASHGERGIGLALIRRACLRRGGSVSVSGSVFTARLPW
ncbi:Sensor histidine kinase regulating citrate/malate metabolism [Lentzea waywayandensis]|uniref:histidine kinase n=1 Tax=Lentzea waywayandensis TaxID=84724 RepID=A0A1I6ELX4_9PSEU|nr:sensor histidine kinase [Lentzea waywayandensis]SFR18551.1 Sensor histidine kinase regulating citrate/malate metabolism [Lentzea waywayandensis]